MKDLEHLISDCKHPNGVPISKVEIKTAKVDLKEQKKIVSGLKKSFKWSSKLRFLQFLVKPIFSKNFKKKKIQRKNFFLKK